MPDPTPSRTPRHADRITRMKTGVVLGSAAALAAVGGLIATSGSGHSAQAATPTTNDTSRNTGNLDQFTGSDDGQPVIVYDPQTNSYYQVPGDGRGAQRFTPGGNVQGGPVMRSGGS